MTFAAIKRRKQESRASKPRLTKKKLRLVRSNPVGAGPSEERVPPGLASPDQELETSFEIGQNPDLDDADVHHSWKKGLRKKLNGLK